MDAVGKTAKKEPPLRVCRCEVTAENARYIRPQSAHDSTAVQTAPLHTGREGLVTSDWSGKLSRKVSLRLIPDVSEDQEEVNGVIRSRGVRLPDFFRLEGKSGENLAYVCFGSLSLCNLAVMHTCSVITMHD